MKLRLILLVSLVGGCVNTETASIHLKLDRTACPSTISSLSLFVLRIDTSSLCGLSEGVDSAGSGVVLPLFKVDGTEVAVLALGYGTAPADAGPDRDGRDGPRPLDQAKYDVAPPPKHDVASPPQCGNTVCESGETCKTCPADCGSCPKDIGPPPVDGSAAYGLGACAQCYGLARVLLGVQSHTLKLLSVEGCKVPASALQQAGLPAGALPPAACP